MDYLTEVIAQKYDRPSLVRKWQAGRKRPLLLFYGHKSPGDGSIGPQVLSQWQRTSFSWRGVSYFCMEQFMMEAKARLFRDPYRQGLILKSKDPQEIKRLGRQIENFRGELWDRQKFTIVYFGNYLKFSQNSALGDYLVSTSPKVLAEASPYDAIWGIKLGAQDPRAHDPSQWLGQNLLGWALMQVRDKLLEERGTDEAPSLVEVG